MPFSDPMADGPTIQAAGKRALDAGATLPGMLKLVKDFRAKNDTTPLILMGYYNPVYRYGPEKFCRDATAVGVDGVILVDLPPEEEEEIRPYLNASGLKLIRLIAPTSAGKDQKGRLPMLSASAGGFVYYISITGITGAASADSGLLRKQVENLRRYTKLPVAVGFGIRTAEQVKEMAQFADAVVVGSALVNVVSGKDTASAVASAKEFVSSLAKGLQR